MSPTNSTAAACRCQGRSTLWDAEKVEEVIEAADGGAEAILGEGASAVGLADVEGEAAEPGEDTWVAAAAGAIFAHGDVAAGVGGGLRRPAASGGGGGTAGGDPGGGGGEGGL